MDLDRFERIARETKASGSLRESGEETLHPFDVRNVHPSLPSKVRTLFDDGHYAEATFCAFKYLDRTVSKHSGLSKSGEGLMMEAFNENAPKIKLNLSKTASDKDEQRGFKHIFSGGVVGIRNPRGHEIDLDDVEVCLDYLVFVSMLLRKMEQAGYR